MWLPVIVALALRLVLVAFLYPGQLNPRLDHWPFGYETGRIARAIASGRGFSDPLPVETGPTAWMAPIYPYLVAATFKLLGIYTAASASVLLSLNSLCSALTCLPVFFIARKSFGPRAGIWSAWAWAFLPYAVLLPADMIWETCLTTLLLSLLFLLAIHLERSTNLGEWAGFGLLSGATALASPAVITLLPFLAGWACYQLHRRRMRWAPQAAAAGLIFVLTLLPWETRNYRTFHHFVPLRDNFWLEMAVDNNGDTSYWPSETAHPSLNSTESNQFRRLGETGYMAAKRREALDFIAGHPRWFVLTTLRRVACTWTGMWSLPQLPIEEHFDPDEAFDPANVLLCTTLSFLALLGLRRAFLERAETRWLYAFALAIFPSVYYITRPYLRYRHPIDPEMVILAVYAVASWRRLGVKSPQHSRPSSEPA